MKKHHKHQKKSKKYSDELANGDADDDKELQDERDTEDDVVQDTGFASRSSWLARKKRNMNLLQLKKKTHLRSRKESDELANGDSADDKEVQDEYDGEDDIV